MKAEKIQPTPPAAEVRLTMSLAEAQLLQLLISKMSPRIFCEITNTNEKTNRQPVLNFLCDMHTALKEAD